MTSGIVYEIPYWDWLKTYTEDMSNKTCYQEIEKSWQGSSSYQFVCYYSTPLILIKQPLLTLLLKVVNLFVTSMYVYIHS